MSPLNIWQHIIYKGSSFRDSSLIIMDMVKDTGIRMFETLVWNLQMWILHLLKPCVATPCCSVRSCGWVEAPAAHPDGLWRDLLFGDLTAFTVWLYTLQYSVEVCTHLCQGLRHSLTAVLWRSKALHDGCLTHFCCKIFSGLSIYALTLSLPFPVYVCVCVCVCVRSTFSYVHALRHAVKDVGNPHTWPRGKAKHSWISDHSTPCPCHPPSITDFNRKWQHLWMWLSWHQSGKSLMSDFDV